MKLYRFTLTATIAAPTKTDSKELTQVCSAIKESYERQFMNRVLMEDVEVQLEEIK